MIENHLSGMKARSGAVMFVCSTCKVLPIFAFGSEREGELVYLMICPKCEITLGEWNSLETRENELRAFAKSPKLHH
jgi:hypothetical protein